MNRWNKSEAGRSYSRKWHKEHPVDPAKKRSQHYLRKLGISAQDISNIWDRQKGCCALCGELLGPIGSNRCGLGAVVDHDHSTSKVRGIIHGRCNLLLGYADDSPYRLLQAMAYLDRECNIAGWGTTMCLGCQKNCRT